MKIIVKLFKGYFITFLKGILNKHQDEIVNEILSKLDQTTEYTRKYIVESAYINLSTEIIKKIKEVL